MITAAALAFAMAAMIGKASGQGESPAPVAPPDGATAGTPPAPAPATPPEEPAPAVAPAPTPAPAAAPAAPAPAAATTFLVNPPGVLKKGYGKGVQDYKLYAPGMRFPIDEPTTTLNSQLHGFGGMFLPGNECDPANYNEEWWDTYCETRGGTNRNSLCSSRQIHQGLDVRGGSSATCKAMSSGARNNVKVVAVLDGHVVKIGKYSVKLRTERGVFDYLHLNMKSLPYKQGDLPFAVKAGQVIGYMDDDFGGADTTFHLHFEHRLNIVDKGIVPVPLYCDMVVAYEKDRGKKATMVGGGPRCGEGADAPAPGAPAVTPPHVVSETPGTATPAGPASPLATDPAPAATQPGSSAWMHNGSDMQLTVAADSTAKFTYTRPRDGLAGLVKSGDVLFEGTKSGTKFTGKAKVFSSGCPPVDYDVAGSTRADGAVVLRGVRKVPDATCKIVREINDVLLFRPNRSVVATPAPGPTPTAPPTTTDPPQATAPSTPTVSPPTAAALPASNGKPMCSRSECVDRDKFVASYDQLYQQLHKKPLTPYQAAALNAVINVWDTTPELQNNARLAYILATVYHESFHMIYPIRECMCRDDAGSIECVRRLHVKGKASAYHLRDRETGQSYYGRGQTQLTLRDNFDRIGKKLHVELVKNPDASLELDVSARNAVFGLYEGWYRAPKNDYCRGKCWLGLKLIPFANDRDWLNARDVLIAQGRHNDRVALHGKKILAMLRFIPRAEFDEKYASGTAAAASTPSSTEPAAAAAPPAPDATVGPVTAPAIGEPAPTSAAPQAAPAASPPASETPAAAATTTPPVTSPTTDTAARPGNSALLAKLTSEVEKLERTAGDMQRNADELRRQATVLRSTIDSLKAGGFDKSMEADIEPILRSLGENMEKAVGFDPAVDFKTVWPPSHKPHNWCRTGADKAVADEEFDDDEDKLLDFYSSNAAPLLPAAPSDGDGEKSAAEGVDKLVLTIDAIRPSAATEAAATKSSDSSNTFWALPPLPASRNAGTIKPLAPASRS